MSDNDLIRRGDVIAILSAASRTAQRTIDAIAAIPAALAARQPADPVTNAGCCQPVQPLTVQDAARVLLTALERAQIDMETLKLFFNGQPVAALRAIGEGEA